MTIAAPDKLESAPQGSHATANQPTHQLPATRPYSHHPALHVTLEVLATVRTRVIQTYTIRL